MTESRELLLHELADMYYAEQLLTTVLPKLADEAEDEELSKGFEEHLVQTERHVKNLEKAFEALGEEAKGEKCPGIDGIKTEHDKFMKDEDPSPEICNAFLTGAGARTEHYEIAAYSGAITLAEGLGEAEVVGLLEQNLEEEKAALSKLEAIAKRLASRDKAATA
jgi:ferritin-like metal-binding protein YciE